MLEFDPIPLNRPVSRLRDTFAVENAPVLLDHASGCQIALVACQQYALQASQSSLVQDKPEHLRCESLASFGWAHAVTDVPAIVAEGIGQPMAQSALADYVTAKHQEEHTRRDTIRWIAEPLFPLPDSASETTKIAANLCEHALAPTFPRCTILLQIGNTLFAAGLIWLYEFQVLAIHISTVAPIESGKILPRRTGSA